MLLFLLTMAKGFVWVSIVPPGQHPDEPAHARYVDATVHDKSAWKGSQNASKGPGRTIEAADFDRFRTSPAERYAFTVEADRKREALVASTATARNQDASPTAFEDRIGYPPLYYFIAGQVVRLTDSGTYDRTWLLERLLSVVIASVTIVVQFAILMAIFGGRGGAAGLAALSLTMLPMYTAVESAINPEVLIVLWTSISLLSALRILERPEARKYYAVAGFVLALGMLTKPNMVVLFSPIPYAISLAWWRAERPRPTRHMLVNSLFLFGPAIVLYGSWRIAVTLSGDVRFADYPSPDLSREYFAAFLNHLSVLGQRLFIDSFWGVFGWLDVTLSNWMYDALALVSIASVCTAAIALLLKAATDQIRVCLVGICSLFSLLLFLEFTLFNTGGFTQGRYFFPMIVAIVAVFFWAGDFVLSKRPYVRAAFWCSAPGIVAALHVVAIGNAIVPRFLL